MAYVLTALHLQATSSTTCTTPFHSFDIDFDLEPFSFSTPTARNGRFAKAC